ncbi:MAG: hypothetical protein P8Y73_12570 [Desulfuromonadales bacterium]
MRNFAIPILLMAALILGACSSGNSDAPADTNAHPADWLVMHSTEALASPNYADCKACHGNDLQGSGEVVSCYSCHAYNPTPPFVVHPPTWVDAYFDHRGYAAINGFTSCTSCHGRDLRGQQTIPGCFTASFDGLSCHAEGPGEVPHPLDGSYLNGALHGPIAKADLTACQTCHGQTGGPGSNPRFNVGIESAGGNGCESCHGVNYAHPQAWAGPNSTFHYSAGNIQNACTLCHGLDLDGTGAIGVSCVGCHDSSTAFTLNCTFCHGNPPDGSPDMATNNGVDHSEVPSDPHLICTICHGMSPSAGGNTFRPATHYALFDYATDTNGDHWDGNIQMSLVSQYNENNFGCDAAGCHGNNSEFQLSDSGLPVLLKDFFGSN